MWKKINQKNLLLCGFLLLSFVDRQKCSFFTKGVVAVNHSANATFQRRYEKETYREMYGIYQPGKTKQITISRYIHFFGQLCVKYIVVPGKQKFPLLPQFSGAAP